MAYNLIKHFLCEETRQKIIVLRSKPEDPSTSAYSSVIHQILLIFWSAGNWQEVLRAHIEPDQLPVAYGGNLTDPDGDSRCRTMVSAQRGACEPWGAFFWNNHRSLAPDQIWRHGAKVLLCPGLCEGSVRQQRDRRPGRRVPAGV